MTTMTDKEKLTVLMDHFARGSQQRFADIIGVPRSNVATWMHRGSITAGGREAILDALPQVSREWLRGGEGEMTPEPAEILFSPEECIPFFGESRASCGVTEQIDNPSLVSDYIRLPGMRGRLAIRAEGDSMEPSIHAGDLCIVGGEVGLGEVNRHSIYMIVTRADQCMFKRIEDPGPAEPTFTVVSENPAYSPHRQRVEKEDVRFIFPLRYVVRQMG